MKLKSLIFIGLCQLPHLGVVAQYSFSEATDIVVIENDTSLKAALSGGFSNAQLNEIDLNQDGILDLVVYDRNYGLPKTYLNDGIPNTVSYTYSPEYAYKFPEMKDFLLTRDYNNDGKMDLFIGSFNVVLYENKSSLSEGLLFEEITTIQTINNPGSRPIDLNPTGSNLPGIYDIDRDQDLDLFINFQSRNIDYHRNLSVDRSNNFVPDFERRSSCWGSFLEAENPSGTIFDSVYLDTCHLATRGERTRSKGVKHGGGLTITPVDIDNNYSTDALIADAGSYQMKLMLNADSGNTNYYTNSKIYKVLDSFPSYDVPVHLIFAAAYLIDVNNDDKKDLLVASNQVNSFSAPFSRDDIWYYKNISPNQQEYVFQLQTKRFLQEQTLDFGRLSKPVFFDYNQDGLKDLLVGNGGELLPNDSSLFIESLAVLKNVGTKKSPRFELVDRNYLNLSSVPFGFTRNGLAFASPAVGDLDGDGDDDLLVTQKNGNIFLFEDTSAIGEEAKFRFHPGSFQNIRDRLVIPRGTQLFDVNNDGILELIVTEVSKVTYYPNFGTTQQPLFNIPLDSLYWINGDQMRYHFREAPNYSMLAIGDSMAVNNAQKLKNTISDALIILKIDTINHFIECLNTRRDGVGSNELDEYGSNAHMTFFHREWKFTSSNNRPFIESFFLFKDEKKNHAILSSPDGASYLIEEFVDHLIPTERTLTQAEIPFMPNFGVNPFIYGTDLNGDSIIDLSIGQNTGGMKLLYGSKLTSINDFVSRNSASASHFKVFPNPAESFIVLEANEQTFYDPITFELRTASGQLIHKGQFQNRRHVLSTRHLNSGIYFLTLSTHQFSESKKLVIKPY